MNPIFPELPHTLGVYTLTRLIELRRNSALYEARQTHVDRAVVLEVLQPGVSHAEEVAFLAQARQHAAGSAMPHVADVFESLRAEGIWFVTQELPQGRSLADLAAAGQKLSAQHICHVIAAAAEMYAACRQAGLGAVALAPSSIYVEESGEVHFLSPLVEGEPQQAPEQMQAIAAALWAVCPEEKEAGLGRTVTMLQWLTDGYEGHFLEWDELKDTAGTIITQLRQNARPDSAKPLITLLRERVENTPGVQQVRRFLGSWGTHLGAAAAAILLLSSMGTMFGLGEPVTTGAEGETGILCHQSGKNELVMRSPVTVQEYADFLQAFEEMDEHEQMELREAVSGMSGSPIPLNWAQQCERGDLAAPVTGVSYWQALLYARYKEALIPTAAQLQTVLTVAPGHLDMEWSRTEQESPLPGIYSGPAFLVVGAQGNPIPTGSRDWCAPRCGFRITFPEEQ